MLLSLTSVAIIMLTAFVFSFDDREMIRLHVFDFESVQDLKDFYRYHEDGPPLITTHRGGARKGFPENAIETFENTLKHTWSSIEVDPRYTKDGVAVLFHDQTLDRTSTGRGSILDYTYEELKQLKLKDLYGNVTNYTIPTMEEALEWAKGKTVLFLDNKDVDVLERAKSIQQLEAHAWAVIMTYSFYDAQRVYEYDPDIMMQIFLPDTEAIVQFEKTGIPWDNIVGFVTHQELDDPKIFDLLSEREVMGILGTSRTIDQEYLNGDIDKSEMLLRYRKVIRSGVHIVEPDFGIEAGKALEDKRSKAPVKQHFFRKRDVLKY